MTPEPREYFRQWVDLETRGEAICRAHALRTRDADERAKWALLAEVENGTKAALIRHLRSTGMAVEESADKRREGEIVAEQLAALPWLELWANWRPRIAFFVDELRAFAAAVPDEQRALSARLCEHEEAWLAFIERELAGDPETSMQPLQAYLDKWRGSDDEPTASAPPGLRN